MARKTRTPCQPVMTAAQFGVAEGELYAEMGAIAKAIIAQRAGSFDPTTYRDRDQEALRELIEAKLKGLTVKAREIAAPPLVIDLMAALKRSLAREASGSKRTTAARKQASKTAPDRRQSALLLPVPGGRKRKAQAATESCCRRECRSDRTGQSRDVVFLMRAARRIPLPPPVSVCV